MKKLSKNYQLVALDLDGTLLNEDKKCTENNFKAIEEADKRGITTIIATGRALQGIPEELKNCSAIHYLIATNGATIYKLPNRECIFEESMDFHTTLSLVEELLPLSMVIHLMQDGKGYTPTYKKEIIHKLPISDAMKNYMLINRNFVDNFMDFLKDSKKGAQKITLDFQKSADGTYIDRERAAHIIQKYSDITMVSGGLNNLEVTKKDVSKGNALRKLCSHLEISIEDTVAVGDSGNDYDIMTKAGFGVAMKNAEKEILEIADYITEFDNNHDGIAAFYRNYLV